MRARPLGWLAATVVVVLGSNALASLMTQHTIDQMRAPGVFPEQVRAFELWLVPKYVAATYPGLALLALVWMWPIAAWFRAGSPGPAPPRVQRRAVSSPLAVAGIGFLGWVLSLIVMPAATVWRFGHWSPALMSQQILSPLVNGFLAAATSYLFVEWIFRRSVIPVVFPHGGVADVTGTFALGVRGRLVVFLIAVGFVPVFTLTGLLRAAAVRLENGIPVEDVVPLLARSSAIAFGVFLVLGIVLTLSLAQTFTRPLGEMATALRRLRRGDLEATVAVRSSDEVGVLEDGLNAMVAALRERERILQTFGRIVEPAVRDRLLRGDLEPGGELRTATVLFCDLTGFTGLGESTTPRELIATLNGFFAVATPWARDCGGYVDKFMGDAMLVVFGLHEPADDDGAHAALRCALGMRERVAALNADRAARGEPGLALEVGVHTGPLVAGTVGAVDRHEYTVIGDTVNVAARLEEMCGSLGRDVLLSEATWRAAARTGALPPADTIDGVRLRGRGEPLRLHAPLRETPRPGAIPGASG